jgi:hypothetical protein
VAKFGNLSSLHRLRAVRFCFDVDIVREILGMATNFVSRISQYFGGSATRFLALVFLLTFLLSSLHAFFPVTSAWDEHSHLSYVQYAFEWRIPHEGSPLNSWAMEAFSCHLHEFYGYMTQVPCGEIGVPTQYPAGGNTAAAWPPVYYMLVAVLMRIPLVFISDPLIAARIATAFIWSVGITWLSLQLFRKARRFSLALAFAFVTVSIPAFTQFSSFVSPHALNPLLVAGGLYVSDRFVGSLRLSQSPRADSESVLHLRTLVFNKWFVLFAIFGAISALSIPHSVSVVLIFGLYLVLATWQKLFVNIRFTNKVAVTFLELALTTLPFFAATFFWQWIHKIRTLDVPAFPAQNPEISTSDTPLSVPGVFSTIVGKFWEFWPSSLQAQWPSGDSALFIQNIWVNIILALSLGAVLFWKAKSWLSSLMLSLFLVAPVMAVLFDLAFTFPVPKRYALGIALIGLISLASSRIPDKIGKGLFLLALLTYLSSFVLDPLKVDVTKCAGTGSEILCRLLG